jgi:hypothetical protein
MLPICFPLLEDLLFPYSLSLKVLVHDLEMNVSWGGFVRDLARAIKQDEENTGKSKTTSDSWRKARENHDFHAYLLRSEATSKEDRRV